MARWFVDRLPQRGIPSVSLRRLLPEARFLGCRDWEISGCSADSRRLDPGQLFVAIRGRTHDGHDFVGQALERGAAGVVVERPCPEAGRLQVIVPDSRAALARLCHALAGDPAEQLSLLGVTGLSGRAATAQFFRAICEATGRRYGAVGAEGWSDGVKARHLGPGLPGPENLSGMLAEMGDRGCAGAVIEVPEEALERRRFEGIEFAAAVATASVGRGDSGSHDRIARRRREARLFRKVVPGGVSVVSADDPAASLLGAVNLDTRRVCYATDAEADVSGRIEQLDGRRSRFMLRGFEREAAVDLRLIGPGNVSHALAAAAVAWSQGIAVDSVVAGLESVTHLPGRLEEVDEGQDFLVRIDQACNGSELAEALTALRAVARGKVHCVLGAEGCQERSVRIGLAAAAESGSDRIVLTTDNPRTEDPNQIFDDLLSGFLRPGRIRIEPDRRQAIESALADARSGDAVLIAGKGRRTFQIFADRAVPFDDRDAAVRWLRANPRQSRRASA